MKLLGPVQAETDSKGSRVGGRSVEDLAGHERDSTPNGSEIELGNIRAFGQVYRPMLGL